MKLPLPDFGKEIKVGDPSFVYKGIYNAIYWDGNDPYRPRVENLVIRNGKEVFLRLYDEVNDGFVYRYRIPGGSLDNDSTKIEQAENETNEEALLKVKNIASSGVAYFESFPEGYKLKKGDICLLYKGNITDVFVSEYAGKMDKSKIDPHDLDDDMAMNGRFHYITQVAQLLRQEHVDALLNSPLVDDITKTLMLRLRRGDIEAKKSYRNLYDEMIPNSKKYDTMLESVSPNKIPRSTKLYHGSPIQNIKTIEPHVSRSYADYGPVVFASEYPEFVACFGTNWNDDVMRQSSTTYPDGTTEITLRVIDKSIIKTWDRPCSMYELVNDGSFTRIPNHPKEVVSNNRIRVKKEIKFNSFWDMIKPYNINVVDYHTGAPITRNEKGDKKIYLVVSHYKSPFGNAVRAVTGGYYNHAGLALNKELNPMYTYSRRTDTNEGRILGGFAVESFRDFKHGKLDDIDIKVIACDVTKDQYDYVTERMDFLSKNIPKTHYNFANLLTSAFKIPINDNLSSDLTSICSVFIATVMKAIGHPVSGKPVNLVTPDDIAACDSMSGFKSVYMGGVNKFTSVTEQNNVYELQPVSKDVKIYHGSPVQNIKEVKAFHNDRIYSELGPVIFTSSYPSFAACYGTHWDDTTMKQNMDWDNGTLTSVSIALTDPDITKDWDKPCSLYELENHGNFKQLPNHPCEIISPIPAKVIKETKFNSFWDMAKQFGIKIVYPDGNDLANVMTESTLCRNDRSKRLQRIQEMRNPVSEIGAFSASTSGGSDANLSSLRRDKIDRHLIDTLSKQYKSLQHVRVDENCNGYIYFDKESSPIAIINVEELTNGKKVVQNLTVVASYADSGLEEQLISVASRELGANFATVSKKNEELIKAYKSNGFREVGDSPISVSLQKGEITTESTQASTLIRNFKKKTGGNFEFISIHDPKAKEYLPKDRNYAQSFKPYMSSTRGDIVIDKDTGKVAGCVYVGGGSKARNRNYGFIQTLEVYDEYKGYGLGKQLLDNAIRKYDATDLTVYKDNEVALNMYKKRGFVIIGYGNDKPNDYWMKLRSKLTKDDQIMMESTRSELPDSEFGIPSQRKYELDTKKHVLSAIKLFNWVDEEHEKELATNILKKIDNFHISDDEIHCTEKNRFYKYWKSGVTEAYIRNTDDIYYNKDKFDSGEINLCFITGHSGSGKSTMGYELMDDDKKLETYGLDDIIANWAYSDKNLEQYGDMIASFFKGPGKKFRYHSKQDWLDDERWDNKDEYVDGYEISAITAFVKYAIKYSKSHRDRKFVLEGVWVFHFIDPEELEDYAVYIKGTSALISKYRASKRDTGDAETTIGKIRAFGQNMTQNWKNYFMDEKKIQRYRDYFSTRL